MDALSRPENLPPGITPAEAVVFLRHLASLCHVQPIYFSWRPFLPDLDDDMVLELAAAAEAKYLVTHHVKEFVGLETFGVTVVSPGEFLRVVRGDA